MGTRGSRNSCIFMSLLYARGVLNKSRVATSRTGFGTTLFFLLCPLTSNFDLLRRPEPTPLTIPRFRHDIPLHEHPSRLVQCVLIPAVTSSFDVWEGLTPHGEHVLQRFK